MLALLLKSPMSTQLAGRALHSAFGYWNLDTWMGDCCYMGAAGMIAVNVGSRLNLTTDELLAGFRQHFGIPFTIIVPVTLALIVHSPNANRPIPDMFDAPTDHWLDAHWTVTSLFVGYTLIQSLRVLAIIRRDPRNTTTATVYMVACAVAVGACVLRLVTTWSNDDYAHWFWSLNAGIAIAFAQVSAYSWRKKIRWLDGVSPRS